MHIHVDVHIRTCMYVYMFKVLDQAYIICTYIISYNHGDFNHGDCNHGDSFGNCTHVAFNTGLPPSLIMF